MADRRGNRSKRAYKNEFPWQGTNDIPVLFAVLFLALVFGVFGMNAKEASAAISTTAKYLTQGRVTNETSVTTGCPENFKIYMYGQYQSGSGTLTMDSRLTGRMSLLRLKRAW